MWIRIFILILIVQVGGIHDVHAQKKKKKTASFSFNASLGTTYDDNILKYSDKYLERFMNREDEGRFHIDTYDDVILSPSIKFAYTYKLFGKQKTILNADFSHKQYMRNDIKNWSSMTLGIRQYTKYRMSFKAYYSYIPRFYVRHFRDHDWIELYGYTPETFQPYAFSKESYSIYGQKYLFKNTRIRLDFSYMRYFHNEHFTEYDCINILFGGKIYQNITKKLKLTAGYKYITSDAKGTPGIDEDPTITKATDASYVEDGYELQLAYSLPRIYKKRNSLTAKATYAKRYYSSTHPLELDREHAGREDKNLRLYFTYKITLNKSFNVSLFYNYYVRDTETTALENTEYLSNEKDYNQNLTGIQISYSLKK